MSFYQFTKNENKSIIWSLLHEGGVFKDLPNNQLENVKKQFENTILSMKPEFDLFFEQNDEGDTDYQQKASIMIMNSNKAVIKKMVQQISLLKVKRPNDGRPPAQRVAAVNLPTPLRFGGGSGTATAAAAAATVTVTGVPTKKQKVEEIYRADDLQKNRMSELEIRLKEKQSEMDNMLNNKKPEQINFIDKSVTDDKLSSNEMDRLLAEALSSRSRELDTLVPSDNAKLPESVASSVRDMTLKRPQESVKKNVSFNEPGNEQITYSNDVNIGTDMNKDLNGMVYATTDDDEEGGGGDIRIFEKRKTDETANAGESHKLNEKINIIQNELQDIKRIQDRILSILERKNNP
jgi:hypothetical protein